MPTDKLGIHGGLERFEALYHVLNCFRRLRMEMKPSAAIDDRFARPAPPEGEHRRATGLSFQRRDAEILFSRENERPRPLEMIKQHRKRLIAEQRHVGCRKLLDPPELRPGADHDQATIGHLREGLHDEVHLLVGHHSGRTDVEILTDAAHDELRSIDVRIDHRGVTAIGLLDPAANVLRAGNEMIDPLRARMVPKPYPVQEIPGQGTLETFLNTRLSQVLFLQIPSIAHGRIAIADMELTGRGDYALRHSMGVADDQVILRQVQLLYGKWHDRQEALVDVLNKRNLLQDRRLNRLPPQT